MKTFLCVLCALCGSILSAADLTLTDGRVLRDATITGQSAERVTVKHADGLASVAKAQLPAELAAKYPVSAPSAVQNSETDSAKQARLAKVRADETARVARAKAARAERELWLRDNPQEHTVTYRVHTTTPSTKITTLTPQGAQTFVPTTDSYGLWEQTFTAKEGFELQLACAATGSDGRTANFASDVTLTILVDHAEVRREVLPPRSGALVLAWKLGAPDDQQPAVVRAGGSNNNSIDTSPISTGRIIRKDAGFVGTR